MKSSAQIFSKLLLAYFLALPILFGLHSELHQHSDSEGLKGDLETTHFDSNCQLCDLYEAQTAIVETQIFSYGELPDFAPLTVVAEDLVSISREHRFLRGPPTA